MVHRLALLLTLAGLALGAEPAITALDAEQWIVEPGATARVIVRARAEAGQAYHLRAELIPVGGKVAWSQEQDLRARGEQASATFEVPTAGRQPGDHRLRVTLLRDGQTLHARERALMLALPGDLVLLFDGREPIARGLEWDRTGIRPKDVTVDGASARVHEMGYDSRHEAEGWWRSLLVTIADERLRHGQRPIADIELVYRHEADAPVELVADTAAGPRTVAKGWGKRSGWQTLRAALGDARFSAPDLDVDPKQRATDGCDLRFNACTTDGQIRSIRIHLPDARAPQDWTRFLDVAGFASDAGWVVAPGGEDTLAITLRNRALGAWNGTLRIERCAGGGKVLELREHALRIAPGSEQVHRETFSAGDAIGEQLIRWRLLRDGRQDAGWERSWMVAGPDTAFILFEREPIARGLAIAQDQHTRPISIVHDGVERTVWTQTHGSAEVGWWRSLRLRFTDERFTDGAMPVVDVRVRFRQLADAPVNLAADTARGGGRVAGSWGGRGPRYEPDPPIKELHTRIDDAVFGSRQHTGGEQDLLASGCDLRFNTCTADGFVRSVVVQGYDRSDAVVWPRMLRALGEDLGRERYVFAPGEEVPARIRVANRAAIPWTGSANISLSTDLDQTVWTRELPVELAAASEDGLVVPIATGDLAHGVYVLRADIGGHIQTKTFFAVSDTAPLPKAAEGEFLYGMSMPDHSERSMDWADYMGVDLFRNCGLEGARGSGIAEAIAAFEARGLRAHLMWDPPWHADPAERREMIVEHAQRLGRIAREHGDFLHYYELGNEPDLPFFYAGPIDAYLEGYVALYDAIKANDPESVVMNGGLCFHGEDGWERAHELVRKMPKDKLDAWAYHGHGPGARAERNAWERQRKATAAVDMAHLPFIETESGVTGHDAQSLRLQARTVVEKLVYAQSTGMPMFLWFTFGTGPDGDFAWGICENGREPRPAVLAHRVMVQRTRGLAHAGELDLQAGDAEAHLFAADDGRRTLVAWNPRGVLSRTIAIGPGCSDLTRHDLFGNPQPLAEATPGMLQLTLGPDPIWVSWRTGDAGFTVAVPPAPLQLPPQLAVVPGRPAVLTGSLRSNGDALAGEIRLSTTGEPPLRPADRAHPASVDAGGETALRIAIPTAEAGSSNWPRRWTVFAPIAGEVDPAGFESVPRELVVAGTRYEPIHALSHDHLLDIGPLAGGHAEKKQALAFAELEAAEAGSLRVGAGADWWMEWFVNGERVYSTMEHGNRGPKDPTAHGFDLPLRAGSNLIAVRVLSGSDGWELASAGGAELAALQRAASGVRDALRVDLLVDGRLLVREDLPVRVLPPVFPLDDGSVASGAADLALGRVDNRFMAQPEEDRWYQGEHDLSGRAWLRQDGETLHLALAVRDDVAQPGDGATVHLATGADLATRATFEPTGERDDATGTTWYRLSIPAATIGDDRFALRIAVRDDDWGEPKQTATTAGGEDPEHWHQSWLQR